MIHGKPYDDHDLLIELQAGGQSAFTIIFNRHYPSLLRYAQRFVPLQKAEDILSESFTKLWICKNNFPSVAQLHQWLKVTIRNAAVNYIRDQKNISLRQQEFLSRLNFHLEEDYFESMVESELFAHIVAQIERLAPQQRRIVHLSFFKGIHNKAIAEQLGISLQAVKNQKATALKILRRIFANRDLVHSLSPLLWAICFPLL